MSRMFVYSTLEGLGLYINNITLKVTVRHFAAINACARFSN